MNFVLNCPVELVARLLGDWLTLVQLSRLEVAMCSNQHRPTLMTIYELIILIADATNSIKEHGHQMLDWLVTRRIIVSSLQMLRPLPCCKHQAHGLVNLFKATPSEIERSQHWVCAGFSASRRVPLLRAHQRSRSARLQYAQTFLSDAERVAQSKKASYRQLHGNI